MPPPLPPDAVHVNVPNPSVCKIYPFNPPSIETLATSPNEVVPNILMFSVVRKFVVLLNVRLALAPIQTLLLNNNCVFAPGIKDCPLA